jgi:hypothetical protein
MLNGDVPGRLVAGDQCSFEAEAIVGQCRFETESSERWCEDSLNSGGPIYSSAHTGGLKLRLQIFRITFLNGMKTNIYCNEVETDASFPYKMFLIMRNVATLNQTYVFVSLFIL